MRTILLVISFTFLTSATFTQNDPDTIWAGIVSEGMAYHDNTNWYECSGDNFVDLNSDGIIDFSFNFWCYGGMTSQQAEVSIVMGGNNCYLAPLDQGAVIIQNYINSSGGMLAYDEEGSSGNNSGGPWFGVTNKYMAMRITNAGTPFLAWIKMSVSVSAPYAYVYVPCWAYQDFTSGYNDNAEKIGIYPVPVKNLLTVEFRNNADDQYDIRIYNGMGTELLSSKVNYTDNQIDFSSFLPGIYFVEFVPLKGNSFTKKIMKLKE